MKKEWKNFKLDKNKVYMRVGQAVVYTSLYAVMIGLIVVGFLQNTIY